MNYFSRPIPERTGAISGDNRFWSISVVSTNDKSCASVFIDWPLTADTSKLIQQQKRRTWCIGGVENRWLPLTARQGCDSGFTIDDYNGGNSEHLVAVVQSIRRVWSWKSTALWQFCIKYEWTIISSWTVLSWKSTVYITMI